MKKIFTVMIIALLIFPMFSMFAPQAKAVSERVAYWSFDEGSGTIAHDSSGNGNDGVIHTATWTDGIVGKALHFNGVDSWVEVPNSPTLTGLSQITVEAWIQEDSITAQLKGIVSKCDGWAPPTNAEYFLGTNENGKVFFETDHGTAIFSAQTTPLITEAGRWYHVAGTWSGGTYTIYVDGTPVLSGICTPQTTLSNMLPVQIGRHGSWSWVYFQGVIDEVKIYNYGRTAEEIASEYGSARTVGYWKFDEGVGGTASDSSGNGNTGTIGGAQWVDGVQGKALRFDGVDDYVYVPHSSSLDLDGYQMSVEFWMKLGLDWHFGIDHENMCAYDKGDAYTSSLIASSGALRFNLAYVPVRDIPETTKNSWAADTWFHIAEVYDDPYIKIYVNGVLDHSEPVSGPIPHSGFNLCIGAHSLRIAQIWFNGVIDEFAIYNYARTAEEILNDYNSVGVKPEILTMFVDPNTDVDDVWGLPDGGTFTFRNWLQNKGYSVSTVPEAFPNGEITLSGLAQFKAVLAIGDFFETPGNEAHVNTMKDYVNQGGGLILFGQHSHPAILVDEAFGLRWSGSAAGSGDPWSFYVDAAITDYSHPIMEGITALPKAGDVFIDWDCLIDDSPLPSGTAVLARSTGGGGPYDPDNRIALIAFQYGIGKVVVGPWDGLVRPYGPTAVNGWSVVGAPIVENQLLINTIAWLTKSGSALAPSQPQNLQAEPRFLAVRLTWQEPSYKGNPPLQSYRIYRRMYGNPESLLGTTQNTEYVDASVEPYRTYYYYVTAVCAAGESPASDEVGSHAKWFSYSDMFSFKNEPGSFSHTWCEEDIQSFLENIRDYVEQKYPNLYDRIPALHDPIFSDFLFSMLSSLVADMHKMGHCYGMSKTAQQYFMEAQDLPSGIARVWDLHAPSQSTAYSRSLQKIIDDNQNSVADPYLLARFIGLYLDWCPQKSEYEAIKERVSKGIPAIVSLRQKDGTVIPHAVLAYEVDDLSKKIYIYDSNAPGIEFLEFEETQSLFKMKPYRPEYGLVFDRMMYSEIPGDVNLVYDYILSFLDDLLSFNVRCPVDLGVHDSSGRWTGTNSTGAITCEIPNSFYIGSGNLSKSVGIMKPENGTYHITVYGRAPCNYTLGIVCCMGDRVSSQSFTSTISKGQEESYSVLLSQAGQMTSIHWEHVFNDAKRGTMLKISTDDKYFQFIAPNKDFGIKQDPNMISYRNVIAIYYKDSEILMTAIAATGKIVGCTATLLDRQTCKLYWLFTIQKPLSC